MKTKTLAIILNHNLPEYTDRLFENLNNPGNDHYDLVVMDNGSKPEFTSIHTTIKFEKNLYWGGAINEAFRIVLENDIYDSLLFLNNDIEVNGKIIVQELRKELFSGDFVIVSPCIAGDARPWKQMQNWGSKTTRCVNWIDNQAPLIHRKLIEVIRKFDDDLYYGWGQEFICYDICYERNWKIGVCDHLSILHFAKQTLFQRRLFKDFNGESIPTEYMEFEDKAWESYASYFSKHPLRVGTFEELRAYGENYSFI